MLKVVLLLVNLQICLISDVYSSKLQIDPSYSLTPSYLALSYTHARTHLNKFYICIVIITIQTFEDDYLLYLKQKSIIYYNISYIQVSVNYNKL